MNLLWSLLLCLKWRWPDWSDCTNSLAGMNLYCCTEHWEATGVCVQAGSFSLGTPSREAAQILYKLPVFLPQQELQAESRRWWSNYLALGWIMTSTVHLVAITQALADGSTDLWVSPKKREEGWWRCSGTGGLAMSWGHKFEVGRKPSKNAKGSVQLVETQARAHCCLFLLAYKQHRDLKLWADLLLRKM